MGKLHTGLETDENAMAFFEDMKSWEVVRKGGNTDEVLSPVTVVFASVNFFRYPL